MSDSSNANIAPTQATLKQDARDARLSNMRKTVEENLRRQFQSEARVHCQQDIKAFSDCAQENGFWVVFKCRELSNKMNSCMDYYYSEEHFQKYLAQVKANSNSASTPDH